MGPDHQALARGGAGRRRHGCHRCHHRPRCRRLGGFDASERTRWKIQRGGGLRLGSEAFAGRDPRRHRQRQRQHDVDQPAPHLLGPPLGLRDVAATDQARRFHRTDVQRLHHRRRGQPEQAGVAADLPPHEDGRAEPRPILRLQRAHHARRHVQAEGDVIHAQTGGFTGRAQALAAAGEGLVGRVCLRGRHGVGSARCVAEDAACKRIR